MAEPVAPIKLSGLVVVVEDDAPMRRLLQVTLEHVGFTVFAFESAEDALRGLGSLKPKVILVDVGLGGASGYDFCRDVRSSLPDLRIPIVFVTARRTKEDLDKAMAVGGDYFVIKPFTPESLIEGIQKAFLARLRARK
ncbi:MAG: response regulator [Alphaproteobacteria bacterium]|nr:response regulator [Alphaproteobacteria bacterium]